LSYNSKLNDLTQWRAEGCEQGDGPGHTRQRGIQGVKLQKFNAVTRQFFLL